MDLGLWASIFDRFFQLLLPIVVRRTVTKNFGLDVALHFECQLRYYLILVLPNWSANAEAIRADQQQDVKGRDVPANLTYLQL